MTRVVALVADLMDRSRISGAAGSGVEVAFVANAEIERAGVKADLVIVDLSRPGALDAVRGIAAAAPSARIVGFGAHVEAGLLAAGEAAGCTEVLPRSRFFARLDDLLSD